MALAFRVNNPNDFVNVLAIHDEFISILADLREEYSREEMAEVYTAPFVFMPGRYKRPDDSGGWIMFTPIVPWIHEVHFLAANEMKRTGIKNISIEKSVENCQEILKHRDDTIAIFTTHGGYPRVEDIGPGLDEKAVRLSCKIMNWNVPKDWQERRTELCNRRNIQPPIGVLDFVAGCHKNIDTDLSRVVVHNEGNDHDGEPVHI